MLFTDKIIKKMVKKDFLRSILFLCIAICLYFIFFLVLCEEDEATTAKLRGLYNQEKDSLDVVFIGSSVIYSSYNTPLAFHDYGISAYDYCAGNLPFAATKYLIQEVKKTQNPKLFVVNLNSVNKEIDKPLYIRRVVTNMPHSINRIACIIGMRKDLVSTDTSSFWDYYFVLPFFHNNWPAFLDNLRIRLAEGTYVKNDNVHKGYDNIWYDAYDWECSNSFDDSVLELPPISLNEKQADLLCEFCQYCKDEQVPVLFISPPGIMYPQFHQEMKSIYNIIDSYGLDYLDGSSMIKEIGIDSEYYWYDNGHLNSFGATKFTRFFSEYLISNYELDDHRGDSKYDSWEIEYEEDRKHVINNTRLFYHFLNEIKEQKCTAEIFISDARLSDVEKNSMNDILGFSIEDYGNYKLIFSEGKCTNCLSYYGTSDNNESIASIPFIECTIISNEFGLMDYHTCFYLDNKRGIYSNDAIPINMNHDVEIKELLSDTWRNDSFLSSVSYSRKGIINDYRVSFGKEDIFFYSVFALEGEKCYGQRIFIEICNEDNKYRVWEMETMEAQDWADLMGNQLYRYGGAGMHISYGDLPAGRYKMRFYREKRGVFLCPENYYDIEIK